MAETGNQRNLTKGEKTSISKSHEDFSGASGGGGEASAVLSQG